MSQKRELGSEFSEITSLLHNWVSLDRTKGYGLSFVRIFVKTCSIKLASKRIFILYVTLQDPYLSHSTFKFCFSIGQTNESISVPTESTLLEQICCMQATLLGHFSVRSETKMRGAIFAVAIFFCFIFLEASLALRKFLSSHDFVVYQENGPNRTSLGYGSKKQLIWSDEFDFFDVSLHF